MASSSGGVGGIDPQLGPTTRDELKSQFSTREGLYRLVSALEISRSMRPPPLTYGTINTNNQPTGPSPSFRLTFVTLVDGVSGSSSLPPSNLNNSPTNHSRLQKQDSDSETDHTDKFVFNYGKELFVYSFTGSRKIADMAKPIDKRVYKGTYPSCHDFNYLLATQDNLSLLIGFSGGQIQLVDPISKEVNKLYNEDRSIDKTRVTCIRWIPNSTNLFFVSHGSGHIYQYNAELSSGTTVPHFQTIKQGPGYSVSSVKSKTPRNPITRWVLGEGAINEFAFSPCGLYWASVSQDGFLRIFRFDTHEMEGITRSYFGGLICVCWSPDSKYVCVGGEDDLVTVWSFKERRVVARGQGHKSWVSVVAFDPYTTTYGDADFNEELSASHDSHEQSEGCNYHPTQSHNLSCHHSAINDCHLSGVNSCDSLSAANSNKQTSNCISCQSTNKISSPPQMCSNSSSVTNIKHKSTVTMNQNHYLINNSSDQTILKNFVANRFTRPPSENLNSTTRLSVSEPTGTRIPACYRFGSVGQDTQLCLWDLTEDVLKQPFGKSRPTTSSRPPGLSDNNPSFHHSNSNKVSNSHYSHKNNSGSPPQTTSRSIIGNCISSSSASVVAFSSSNSQSHNSGGRHDDVASTGKSVNTMTDVSCSTATITEATKTSNAGGNVGKKGSITSTTTENGSSSQSQSNNSSGHAHGILSLRFGGLVGFGGGGSDKNHTKEHKRNFSLGSTSKSNHSNSGSSSNKAISGGSNVNLGLGTAFNLSDPLKLIGTEACPRLDECPLLEPLICKKISHERLTALIFREECLVTACQDGVICTWCRPGEELRVSSSSALATCSVGQQSRSNKIPSLAQDDSFSYNSKDPSTTTATEQL